MTTETHRLKAQARLHEAGGTVDAAINVIASAFAAQDVLRDRVKNLESTEPQGSDYPRIAHLARLTDFTVEKTKTGQDRTEAARLVLRHINPQLPQHFPEKLETLAKRAAKYYSDELRNEPKIKAYTFDPAGLDDLDLE